MFYESYCGYAVFFDLSREDYWQVSNLFLIDIQSSRPCGFWSSFLFLL